MPISKIELSVEYTMNNSIGLKLLKHLATLSSGLGKQKKLTILIYHRVLDIPDPMRPGEIDISAFTWQMELLANYYNVLPINIALDKLRSDDLPPRAICITFDDGYADNYYNALPILQRLNIKATFFIASGYLDGGRMWNDTIIEVLRIIDLPLLDLSEYGCGKYDFTNSSKRTKAVSKILNKVKRLDTNKMADCINYITSLVGNLPDDLMLTSTQVKALHQAGMTIGGHTVTHPILAKLTNTEVEEEILINKITLENIINDNIDYFAYPNGQVEFDYLPEQTVIIEKMGFKAAFSVDWSCVSKNYDCWQLPRFRPWETTAEKFMMRLIYLLIKL